MREIDYEYIAENIANISRIPVRIYREKKPEIFFNTSGFPVDPASPYLQELLKITKKVSYYITPLYHFYGIIHCGDTTLLLGPTYQNQPSRIQIRDYMFSLGLKEDYLKAYGELQNSITPMPLEMFLHLLCLVYYYVSDEKLDVSRILLYDCSGKISSQEYDALEEPTVPDSIVLQTEPVHDTYDYEKKMLSYVSAGDMDSLQHLFSSTSAGQAGKTAGTYLRQMKNIFIATATLVSRAAIEGGLSRETALSLSDQYIQHCEKHNDPQRILNLQRHMILDYTSQVQHLTNGQPGNLFFRNIAAYISEHITESVSVSRIAKAFYLSPNYLSARFKQESGIPLSSYIQQQKIQKAKEYLKNTDRSILEISTFLGFSSQGYFQNVFKKNTGMTPGEFRKK